MLPTFEMTVAERESVKSTYAIHTPEESAL
jgi:hypothetical protein